MIWEKEGGGVGAAGEWRGGEEEEEGKAVLPSSTIVEILGNHHVSRAAVIYHSSILNVYSALT